MLVTVIIAFIFGILGLAGGIALGFYIKGIIAKARMEDIEAKEKEIIEEAKRKAETILKEAEVKVREEIAARREELTREYEKKKNELSSWETKIKEEQVRVEAEKREIQRKEKEMEKEERKLQEIRAELEKEIAKYKELVEEEEKKLSEISKLSENEAKEIYINRMKEKTEEMVNEILKQKKEELTSKTQEMTAEIIQSALQSADVPTLVEKASTSVVPLPNENMKGRLIGRDGRNIRAFEAATGVDLIIDDTPEIVVVSSFDPVRREIGRRALEMLIEDGKINPVRIEKAVKKAEEEIERVMEEEAKKALFEVKIKRLHPEIIKRMGRLYFRYSYGQNVLYHSIETAKLCEYISAELNLPPESVSIAKRAGFLHDIGKGLEGDHPLPHALAGGEFLQKFGESPAVIHAVKAHHEDIEPQTIEAVIVMIADAISASRPGARKESVENYIKRLIALEEIAKSFEGVVNAYALQAGRELRIMVQPDIIDDGKVPFLAYQIAKKVEEEVEFPGQIKVTVIRETRGVAVAR